MSVLRTRILPLVVLLAAACPVRADDPITSVMDEDPLLPAARLVYGFPNGVAAAWIKALDHPNTAIRCAAAQSIALAHRQGLAGLGAAVAPLVRELERPDQNPTVRLTAAHALVALDARGAADSLLRQLTTDDPELREVIEPALARWDHKPARAVWLGRLAEGPPYHRRHLLAIRALGEVREIQAATRLRDLVLSRSVPTAVRLEAARALAAIRTTGSEADAATLAADKTAGATSRLLAASVLRHHKGEAAVRLLQSLGRDADPTTAAVALARLVEIDTKLVLPLLEPVLASPDANVRAFGVKVLHQQPTDARVRLLGNRLSDPHPDVRSQARVALDDLGTRREFATAVIREGVRVLAGNDWRGQEQAAVLLARRGHKPAASRLLELLPSQRTEAAVAAAWALRMLAVPETLPPAMEFVRQQHQKVLADARAAGIPLPSPEGINRTMSQLIQFFGQVRYRPAEPLLRQMLPRFVPGMPGNPPLTPLTPESRAAVAWALGMLYAGNPVPTVVKELQERLADYPAKPFLGAEYDRVRQLAAVALGRMKASAAVPTLKEYYTGKPTPDPVNNACGWALAQITGVPVPPPGTVEQPASGWFLTPLD